MGYYGLPPELMRDSKWRKTTKYSNLTTPSEYGFREGVLAAAVNVGASDQLGEERPEYNNNIRAA